MKKETKKEIQREYTIKIPVFTSERIEREGGLFPTSYNQVLEGAIASIHEHNEGTKVISSDRRNKTIRKIIGNINYEVNTLDEIPYLLLKISAYNTNWEGCLITSNETVQIANNDKIGSDNNYVMLFPQIIGIENQTFFWIILVYDDPKKDSIDNISTAKLVLTKVLKHPIKSIKLPSFLAELQKNNTRPKIIMNLNSISFDGDNTAAQFEKYCINSKFIKKEEYEFNDMPYEEMEELITIPFNNFKQKVIKFFIGKKEYKLTHELVGDDQNIMDETLEQMFNYQIKVTEEELKDIYESDFVVSKLLPVLEKYLINGMD